MNCLTLRTRGREGGQEEDVIFCSSRWGEERFNAALLLLEHEEKVWVPLQEVGVKLLGGLDGLAHST